MNVLFISSLSNNSLYFHLQETLRHHIMERLYTRVARALQQAPLDPDYLEFVCAQEMVFLDIVAEHVPVFQEVTDVLSELSRSLQNQRQCQHPPPQAIQYEKIHGKGRPKISISKEYLHHTCL